MLKKNNDYVNNILEKISVIRDNEFYLANYKVNEVKIKKKKCDNEIEVNITRSKMKKMANKLKHRHMMRGLDVTEIKTVTDDNHDIILDNNIFNIVKDESKLIQWKNLPFEKKVDLVKIFIKEKYDDFPDETLNKIIDYIDKNKINFKKYINYDPISQIIIDMPIIMYNNNEYS